MNYKFLDIGCKVGGSWGICSKFGFKPEQGIGIDINENHIKNAKEKGFNAVYGDATNLQFEDNSFDLVISNHVFEHLPTREMFDKAVAEAIRVSRKWVYIAFPVFDHDEYLKSLGLKTFYSHWTGHTCMVHLKDLQSMIEKMGYQQETTMVKLMLDSNAREIHSLSSPIDQFEYEANKHPKKPFVKFDRQIHREFKLVITK